MTTAHRARGGLLHGPRGTWWQALWRPFWTLPAVICLAAFAVGVLLPALDTRTRGIEPYVFPGGVDGARSFLGTIASAMISVTGLVFSITMVVLQLASSQFSPRVLGGFLSSRVTQTTLGVFTATFVFALTVLRSVRGASGGQEGFVPQLSVSLAFVLVLMSVGLFLAFIRHITLMIQVTHVISRLGTQTLRLVGEALGEQAGSGGDPTARSRPLWSPPPGTDRVPVTADGHGFLGRLDYRALVAAAQDAGVVVAVEPAIGGFVVPHQPLAHVWGRASLSPEEETAIRRCLRLVPERTLAQDLLFGVRQLVDIADRALSPGVNDPTTAVYVVDELHVVMARLALAPTPSPYILDRAGAVRVVHRGVSLGDVLAVGVDEVGHYAKDAPTVRRRLIALLEDLLTVCRPEHVAELAPRLDSLNAAPAPDGTSRASPAAAGP